LKEQKGKGMLGENVHVQENYSVHIRYQVHDMLVAGNLPLVKDPAPSSCE